MTHNSEEVRPLNPAEQSHLAYFEGIAPTGLLKRWRATLRALRNPAQEQRILYRWALHYQTPEWIQRLEQLSRIPKI